MNSIVTMLQMLKKMEEQRRADRQDFMEIFERLRNDRPSVTTQSLAVHLLEIINVKGFTGERED